MCLIRKCGRCGKVYNTEEYVALPKASYKYGYTHVCDCGYVFGIDTFHLDDTVEIKVEGRTARVNVYTFFREVVSGFDAKPMWYQTLLFPEEEYVECSFSREYETVEEAVEGHREIVEKLRTRQYKLIPCRWSLIVST